MSELTSGAARYQLGLALNALDGTKEQASCNYILDYITHLEAQVEADAALWEFIRERKLDVFYDTVDDKYDAVDCDWTKGLRVYASDPDPREAVRKAMKAETEK